MTLGSKGLHKALPLILGATLAVAALAGEGEEADLGLAAHAELGQILVNAAGNTLYMFLPDAQGESTCYDSCAQNWPPVVSDGDVSLGEGLSQDLVGSVTRTDGSEQVTYGGWPLYTFAADAEAGQAAGQGVNDVWFVLSADGTPVGAPAGENVEDGASGGEVLAALMTEGSRVFAQICAACHGANGNEELVSHVAILAGNSRLENERLVLRRVIHGGGYMPGFGNVLTDREVAAVATFVRNSWGNEFGLVGEEAAAEMR